MSFDASIHKLYLAPSVGLAGKTFYVVILVTTASGGTDKVIANIQVTNGGSGSPPLNAVGAMAVHGFIAGPNPMTSGMWTVRFAPSFPSPRTIFIYDITGRRVASLGSTRTARILWEGKDDATRPLPNGVYWYRIEAGPRREQGRLVMVQ
jgi:hypothetical protein